MRFIRKRALVAVAALAALAGAGQASAACVGDCGGDGEVTVDEIILGVNIALGLGSLSSCGAFDGNGDAEVTIDEVIASVNGALSGCPAVVATPTATATPTQSVPTPTPVCVSDGTASVTATSAVPASGSGALGGCVTVENAGGTRTELTRVTTRGTVNGNDFLLEIYFVTATGEIDTVTYGWVPFQGIPDFYENLAFCNTPGCSGVTMNLATKKISFSVTALTAEAASAVLNGTITLKRIPTPVATPTPACPGGSASLTISDIQGGQSLPSSLDLGMAMNFSQPANPPAPARLSALYDGCPMPFPRNTLGFSFSATSFEAGGMYSVGTFQSAINQIEFREEGFGAAKSWQARSGTFIVDSLVDGVVNFRIVDARMMFQDIGPTRTFVLNASGRLTP